MLKLGSHVSFKSNKYLVGAVEEALSYESTAMMIYLGAPQNTRRAKKEDMCLEEYEKTFAKLMPKEHILVHAPYIINPASVEKWEFARDFLIQEISIMNYLGLKDIVLHPGAHTKFTREEGIATLINTLKEVLDSTQDVNILLETMAGKGTEIGITLEELKYIIDQVGSPRVLICLDTCHLWDAGYDVNNFDEFIKTLKDTGTLPLVQGIHINDSKNEKSAHKDRHANLNTGFIKTEALRKIVHCTEFKDIIKVLETPYVDGKAIYKEEIELLK